jgi:hypothetical protein
MINPEGLSYRILEFDIHLAFACLREAPPPEVLRRAGASAKAGILTFEID